MSGGARVVGASIRGSLHERDGRPNQDALASFVAAHGVAVACCDGHGSRQSPRSDRGSRIAADLAVRFATDLLEREHGRTGDRLDRAGWERVVTDLIRDVTVEWNAAVLAEVRARPFAPDADPPEGDPADPTRAYGTTLMVALSTETYLVVAQIGDGDIVVVDTDGTPLRPIPTDPRFVAGETTSLCLPDAWREARVAVLDVVDQRIAFAFLATDGYGNTFADAGWRDHVAQDFLARLRDEGPDWVEARLGDWLRESATVGGDDVTLALLIPPEPTTTASTSGLASAATELEPESATGPTTAPAAEPTVAADFDRQPSLTNDVDPEPEPTLKPDPEPARELRWDVPPVAPRSGRGAGVAIAIILVLGATLTVAALAALILMGRT